MKILLILALLLSGCATLNTNMSPSESYAKVNRPLAIAGKLKWSDYYLGLYKKLQTESYMNTGNQLVICNELIDTAKELESGKLTQDQFESKRRDALGRLKQLEANAQIENEPSIFSIPYGPAYTPPRATTCTSSGGQTFCTTY
jgi:hypothetical protein